MEEETPDKLEDYEHKDGKKEDAVSRYGCRDKGDVGMKPGDKVWWFDARTQTIECGEALEVNERGGVVYTYDKNLWLGREAFSTREALREHYRKIFE